MEMLGHWPSPPHWVPMMAPSHHSSDVLEVCVVDRVGPQAPVPPAAGEPVCGEVRVNLKSGWEGGTILTLCPPGLERNAVSRDERSGMPFWNAVVAISSSTGDPGSCYNSAGDLGGQDGAGGTTPKSSKSGHSGRGKFRDWPWAASEDR